VVLGRRRGRHEIWWSGWAMVSREHGSVSVPTAAMAKQNAVLPWDERWCWWLEEVEVMAEQLWPR